MVAFAHLGHWYIQILFAVPALGIIGYMTRDSLRKRAAAKRGRLAPPQRDAAAHEPRDPAQG